MIICSPTCLCKKLVDLTPNIYYMIIHYIVIHNFSLIFLTCLHQILFRNICSHYSCTVLLHIVERSALAAVQPLMYGSTEKWRRAASYWNVKCIRKLWAHLSVHFTVKTGNIKLHKWIKVICAQLFLSYQNRIICAKVRALF